MPLSPTRPDRLHGQVFRGTEAVRAGVLTADQLRSTAWRRLRQDVYADARLAVDHRLLARGVSLVMPRTAAFGGLTAAVLWSPPETRLRLLLHRSGLPLPVAQHEIREHGRFVARVDFAWPDRCFAVEYDGVWHGGPGRLAEDRDRLNRLAAAGRRIHFVTKGHMRRPDRLLADIAAALGRR